MVRKNCEICGREVDARGYNVHLRKCREVQTSKLNEIKLKEENMSKEKIEVKPEIKEPDIKNSKTPTVAKITATVLGVLAVVTVGILMLISPKSKESSTKESTQPRNMISRRRR